MVVYQVSKRMFFVNNGVDYAAAVDMDEDVKLFTSYRKAEKEFDNLVNSYAVMYHTEPKLVTRIGCVYQSKEIKGYDRRMIIEITRKETL